MTQILAERTTETGQRRRQIVVREPEPRGACPCCGFGPDEKCAPECIYNGDK